MLTAHAGDRLWIITESDRSVTIMYNLTVVAAFAALIPAIRAAHVDPMQVLR